VVWSSSDDLINSRVQSVRIAAELTPETVQTVPDTAPPAGTFVQFGKTGPQIVVDGSGRTTIVWDRAEITPAIPSVSSSIRSVRFNADGSLGEVETISGDDQFAAVPLIAIDPTYRTTVAWLSSDGSNFLVDSSRISPNPGTTIDSCPTGTIPADQATFTFSGDPTDFVARFQCRIDDGPYADCSSSKTFFGLGDGPHTASFRAEDLAGNQDQTPATRTFTVDTTAPFTTIDSGPTGTITTDEAKFTFSSS
jgi:hypothetical protein